MKTRGNILGIATTLMVVVLVAALCRPIAAQNRVCTAATPGQPMLPPGLRPVVRGSYLGPDAVAASRDGKTLYVALADARRLALFDVAAGKVAQTIALPAEPTALVLSRDGARLYVACAAVKSTVAVIDAAAGKIIDSIPAGHSIHGLALTPDGKRLYVCNRFNNDVSVIEIAGHKEIARVAATREPFSAVVTPDGKSVFVANHLPMDRADSYDVAANITVIDTASNQAASIRLPNGSSSVRGMCCFARRPLRLRSPRALALRIAGHAIGTRLVEHQRDEHH